MVHHQLACLLDPGMCSLNAPSLRQHCKAISIRAAREEIPLARRTRTANIAIGWMAYDLDRNIMLVMDRLCTASCITFINEDRGYSGILLHAIGHDRVSTVTVLHAGRRYTHGKYQPQGINEHMTFRPLIFFPAS